MPRERSQLLGQVALFASSPLAPATMEGRSTPRASSTSRALCWFVGKLDQHEEKRRRMGRMTFKSCSSMTGGALHVVGLSQTGSLGKAAAFGTKELA